MRLTDMNNKKRNFAGMLSIIVLVGLLSACGAEVTEVNEVAAQPQTVATEVSSTDPAPQVETPVAEVNPPVDTSSGEAVSYSKEILPILETSCVKCHGVEKVSRGLDLTSYEKAMAGSVKGPVIQPGDANNSSLVKVIEQGKMPKQGTKLTEAQLELIKNWVNQGAQNN
jgi:mono/diheme cytochrome c family protein